MILTPGRLLFENIVPAHLRGEDDGSPIDAGRVKAILQEVAEKEPNSYRDISHKLLKLGARASTEVSSSFGLEDLKSPVDKASIVAGVRKQEALINARKDLTPQQKINERVKLYGKLSNDLPEQVFTSAMGRGSNLARMVASGARGSKGQLNSNIGADFLMLDANSNPIPVPITHSYAEGLSPGEYFASAYGTRRGLLSTKLSVAESGYLSKQLAAAAHDLVVSKHNCETDRGIPVSPDDKDSIGSVMARGAAGYPAGTIITGRVLRQLRDNKVPSLIVRSPLTCQAPNGICAVCAGIREKNRFPRIMENLGLAASSSVGEPLSQGTLCLAEGTLVRMADGSERPIEKVRPAEWVLGCNTKGGTFPVLVLDRYDNGVKLVVKTTLESGEELISTPHHKVLHHCINAPAEELEVTLVADEAMIEMVVVEEDGYRLIPVADTVAVGEERTYDIEVDHPDHLFVLANGMVVSNSEKHSGGVASSSGKAVSAFKQIDSLVQVPDIFPNAAAIARTDGEVKKIEEAPQGGNYIYVDGEQHYVPHGRDILVKKGDRLEAGDVLSAGVPNPAEIVRHKGVGEGRLYFVNAMRKAMLDNKLPVDRRNLEILGRSLVNHVRITNPDGYGGSLPDDIVEYDSIEHSLGGPDSKPGTPLATSKALGKFLTKPTLHYSIGTRITPSVAKTLADNGESTVETTDESPGFEPEMQRVADIPGFKQDWMSQFAGSNLTRRLKKEVHSGDAVSNVHGTSYIPGLAKGTEFGKPPKGIVGY